MESNHNLEVRMGTATGGVLTFLAFVSQADLGRTAVLAAFGAVVSYAVSVALKRLFGRRRRKPAGGRWRNR